MLATNPFTLLPKEWIEVPIIEHLQQITSRFPNKTALVFNKQHISYSEFISEVRKKSNELKKHLNSQKPIAIWLDIEPAFIITKFACLSLGIPYVPLDANFPTQRNLDIIEHADVQLIVTNKEFQAQIQSSSNIPLFILEKGNIVDNNTPNNNIPTLPTSESISYIIYTSGSTGKPKGVYQNQRNQLHDVWQYINSVQLTSNDRVSYCYSPSVNGSIRDTFGSLLVGATLYLTNIKKYSISSLNTYLVDNEISIFHAIPTIFRTLFLVHKNLFLRYVRIIYLAGDRIFRSDFELYKTKFSDSCMLYVGIGSTENATLFRHWILNKQTTIESNLLPVGYPIEDREMTIRDSAGKIVDSGEIGEIFVKSKYLSLGYWKDEELTQQYYTFHPDTSRQFRTGDLGRELENGLLEFIGRKDKQLKINGHRVETDEIRATILGMQEIENVAIISREINNQFKIVAYIQTKQETTQIQQKIKTILPNFMVPSYYYFVEAIPLLSNYKLDLNAINQIDKENYLREQSLVSEQNSLEDKVQQIWTKYTGNSEFSTDISWSETGANSIDLLNFLVDLEQEFNIHYPTDFITKEMTHSFVISKLKTIEEKKNKVDLSNKPVIYFFPWLCGVTKEHNELIRNLSHHYNCKTIQYPKLGKLYSLEKLINLLHAQVSKEYSTNQTNVFIGILDGGICAYLLANQFKNMPQLIMINTEAKTYSFYAKLKIKIKRLLSIDTRPYLYLKEKRNKTNYKIELLTFNNQKKINSTSLGWDSINSNNTLKDFDFPFNPLNEKNLKDIENYITSKIPVI